MSVFANKVISFENILESGSPTHKLYFLKSTDITTYPCGRRNSTIIEGSDPRTTMDNFYYPFDPEARLNTEDNNRRVSSINGYTQNFIKSWDENGLHLVLGGYSFKIPNATNISSFCREKFDDSLTGELYANIRIEEIPLYESTELNYFSWVLRAQNDSAYGDPPCLDHLIDANAGIDKSNYYFSGLSFTDTPIVPFTDYTTVLNEELSRDMPAYSIKEYEGREEDSTLNLATNQIVISLRIATRKNGTWELCQNSLLPDIRHGILPGEVELGHLFVEGNEEVRGNIKANNPNANNATGAHAYFYHVTIDGNLIVKKNAIFQSDVVIKGNLDVANTIDTKFLVASDAQVTGDISRMHGETPMGLVTVELKNSDRVQDPDDPKTDTSSITDRTNAWHTRPRLHIYTKNNATGPHKLTRVPLITQVTDPESN